MSVRKEDRRKNCPSRGLEITAETIGVCAGAALCYVFNKRQTAERPAVNGATSSWLIEVEHAMRHSSPSRHDSSFHTVSEHSTSDTSINSEDVPDDEMRTVSLRNRVENRERSWALDQCSICFGMMQKEQEVFSLACSHRFHQSCILLLCLEQHQICPVCRKPS